MTWKNIPGYPNFYWMSNKALIYRDTRIVKHKLKHNKTIYGGYLPEYKDGQ